MTAIAVTPLAAVAEDRRGREVPWSQWLQELTEHLTTYGAYPTCRTSLGRWVSRQRIALKQGLLPIGCVAQLEALPGWLWDARPDPWPSHFERLQDCLAQHGKYPGRGKQPWAAVGEWVVKQRDAYANGVLSDERVRLLEGLPGWTWETSLWGRSFGEYAAHLKETGRPPASGTSLYEWAGRQRRLYAAGRLTAAQVSQLEGLPCWTWNPREESWQQQYGRVADALLAGRANLRGDSRWVEVQRRAYRLGSLSDERIAQLESLPGWRWRKPSWDERCSELSGYIAENGRLGPTSRTLRRWIQTQQAAYHAGGLSADQIHRLETMPGWSWGPVSAAWAVERP